MLKKEQIAMITMVAALIAASILVLPMLGVNLPTREAGNEPLDCAMTAQSGNMVGFDISQCVLFKTLYTDCSPFFAPITVTQGSYRDETFTANEECNLNDRANNKMYFKLEGPPPVTEDFSDCSEWFVIAEGTTPCSFGEWHSSEEGEFLIGTDSIYIDYYLSGDIPVTISYDYYAGPGSVTVYLSPQSNSLGNDFILRALGRQNLVQILDASGEEGPQCPYTFNQGQTYNLKFEVYSDGTIFASVDNILLCSYPFSNTEKLFNAHYVILGSRSLDDRLDNLAISYE